MAKPKQKQKTNDNNDDDTNSSKGIEWDPQLDDNWVMVKKQKITILIPPLPITEQIPIPNPEESNPQTILPTKRAKQKSKTKSTPLTTTSVQHIRFLNPNPIPNPEESNPQTVLPENTTKNQKTNPVLDNKKSNLKSKLTPLIATSVQQVLNPKPSLVPNQVESNPQTVLPENTMKTRETNLVLENKKSKSTALTASSVQQVLNPNPGLISDQEENNPQTVLPENTTEHQMVLKPALENEKSKSTRLTATYTQQVPNLEHKQKPNPGVTIRQTKNVRRRICCQYRGIMVNNSMRAMNVERKLRRAGGLKKWLLSMGLEEIQRIFQGKCVGKFQLVNLTMKKLKDMGVAAVGPRRKLIHALDCICQPGCFEVVCE